MDNYTSLSTDVEAEYDAFCIDPTRDMSVFYEKLLRYLKYMIWKFMNENQYVDKIEIEDIANDVLEKVVEEKLESYQKDQAKFTTYCAVIAKNKVLNWKKKHMRVCLDVEGDFEEGLEATTYSRDYHSPEQKLLICETQLEMAAMVKKYVKTLMDWKQKPYRTVSCGFTMIVFQKYHPNTTELTSPKWAFDVLKPQNVQQGADQFLSEIRAWMPNVAFQWSDDFLDAMDEMEDGIFVGDIVFGERFKTKDFENWSIRLREKLKRQLLESEKELCF